MEFCGLTPPPPIPHRALTYEPPNPTHFPLHAVDMRSSTRSQSSADRGAGTFAPLPGSGSDSAMSDSNYAKPGSSGTHVCRNQQTPTLPGSNPACPSTLCFNDHQERLAIMVPGPETSPARPDLRSPFRPHTGDKTHPNMIGEPSIPTDQSVEAHDQPRYERPQITVQLYLHSHCRAFHNEHNLRNVDQWCRQLQCSPAFQYLRNKLSVHGGLTGVSPNIRIEAYDALADYKDIIDHSLNEREYRGLQECFEHIERFLRYTKRMSSDPGFAVSGHAIAKAKDYVENRNFIKHQMEDIRSGDGGKNRRRRAALREQLGPAFNDGRGLETDEASDSFGSTSSCNRPQPFADLSVSRSTVDRPPTDSGMTVGAARSPSAGFRTSHSRSPQQLNLSPGQAQHRMQEQRTQAISPSLLDPRLRQHAPTNQIQPQQSQNQPTVSQQAGQQAQNRSGGQAPPASSSLMAPPPTPAQGFQRPGLALPREGSVARPFNLAPFPLDVKSIYRGVSQPYHNVVLVIDAPHWATTAGIGVLRFGYEDDWAKGENIHRSGACFERVSMTQGTGWRWLGDALVECFVGDGHDHEDIPAWLRNEGEAGDRDGSLWPGRDGGTDEGFGIVSGTGTGSGPMEAETVRMLRKLSVPGAETVDFVDGEWCGLV